MKSSAQAVLNLASLINHDASLYEVEDQGLLAPEVALLEADDLSLAEPLNWHIIVRSTGGDDDFILEGNVKGKALMDCRRCLDGVAVEASSSFVYPMMYKAGIESLQLREDDTEEDDVLVFGRPNVDFAELITQLFAIELPLTALCREDCRGLSADGVNLNEHPELIPEVKSEEKPSPFSALKDIEL